MASVTPLRLLLGLVAVLAGAALITTPLSPRETAVVTGLGLAFTGAALLLRERGASPERGDAPAGSARTGGERAAGWAIIALGAVVSVAPSLGATWVAFLIATALIVHGALSLLRALRPSARDGAGRPSAHRLADATAGAAGIVFGSLAFVWPVLTLTVFRFAVGAWFVFFGLRLLFDLLFRQGSRHDPRGEPARVPAWRRWVRALGATAALALALAFAWGSGTVLGGAPLPEPGRFYEAPEAVPDSPGRLIRSEPLTTGVPTGAQAWRILYTTTRPDGSPAISSGTVIAPRQHGDAPLPLLSIAHGTTGVASKCAPSLSATPFADGAGTALAEMVTRHGWAAVISDYVGLGTAGPHPYLVGEAEARNVLDASRAVQQFETIRTTTDTVVWGHSQGGQGALWTGQIAERYAPELTVKGVAAFAPAADLYGLAEADKTEAAGKTVSAYIASTWNDLYPGLRLEQQLTPGSEGGVERIRDLCFNGSDVLGAILSGTQIPNQVFPDRLLAGEFGDRLKAQTPVGPWPAPVLVAQGLADPLVKPAMQGDWVAGRCAAGETIDYRTFPGLSHNTLVAADSPLTPQIVAWTLDRWRGEAPTPNCDDPPSSVAD